ncbi:MAG: sigma-70 family RNA polymerase sigma factor [Myxococcota bacterium]|jgi:RNA polymerase sigma-70 factor (ECF subfamily)|nr:sigma-70 family RNA polymerase sigma factor [Myxococcota bacterium]
MDHHEGNPRVKPAEQESASTRAMLDQANVPDREAHICALYDANYERIYRIGLRYGGGRQDWAEDIIQEVFITMVDHLDTLKEGVDPGPWLARVATNKCLNKLRRESRWNALLPSWARTHQQQSYNLDPELLADARQSVRRAYELIQDLPPKERAAFFMHRLDGMTQEEVGEQLGHTKGYVNKLIKRAEQRLLDAGWSDES